jgi:chromosome segregation ATPase
MMNEKSWETLAKQLQESLKIVTQQRDAAESDVARNRAAIKTVREDCRVIRQQRDFARDEVKSLRIDTSTRIATLEGFITKGHEDYCKIKADLENRIADLKDILQMRKEENTQLQILNVELDKVIDGLRKDMHFARDQRDKLAADWEQAWQAHSIETEARLNCEELRQNQLHELRAVRIENEALRKRLNWSRQEAAELEAK